MTTVLDFFIHSVANTVVAHIDPVLADDGGDLNGDGGGATRRRQLLLL